MGSEMCIRDSQGADREDVAQDAADAGGRALERLDGAGMVVRLDLERARQAVAHVDGAGVIDVGDGLAVAIRIESHNHPSAVEPYQGAATGVGGIIRDVFSMGARPIALMDPLRFGPLDDARTRYLVEGVVAGISGYGNAVGVPTVGGEVVFDECYRDNPLVNVLCLGILP